MATEAWWHFATTAAVAQRWHHDKNGGGCGDVGGTGTMETAAMARVGDSSSGAGRMERAAVTLQRWRLQW